MEPPHRAARVARTGVAQGKRLSPVTKNALTWIYGRATVRVCTGCRALCFRARWILDERVARSSGLAGKAVGTPLSRGVRFAQTYSAGSPTHAASFLPSNACGCGPYAGASTVSSQLPACRRLPEVA